MSFWDSMHIGTSALNAQRLRLDLISNNIANIQTTHTADGGPYKRKDVVFSTQGENTFLPTLVLASQRQNALQANDLNLGGVQVADVITDQTPGQQIYDPTHPDADQNGYVTMPNVDLVVEMTNMLSATRSYEANLATIDNAKRMAIKALDIGR